MCQKGKEDYKIQFIVFFINNNRYEVQHSNYFKVQREIISNIVLDIPLNIHIRRKVIHTTQELDYN